MISDEDDISEVSVSPDYFGKLDDRENYTSFPFGSLSPEEYSVQAENDQTQVKYGLLWNGLQNLLALVPSPRSFQPHNQIYKGELDTNLDSSFIFVPGNEEVTENVIEMNVPSENTYLNKRNERKKKWTHYPEKNSLFQRSNLLCVKICRRSLKVIVYDRNL
jgi:hypothetical protein